jgi:hypothetical protein
VTSAVLSLSRDKSVILPTVTWALLLRHPIVAAQVCIKISKRSNLSAGVDNALVLGLGSKRPNVQHCKGTFGVPKQCDIVDCMSVKSSQ